MEPADNPEKQKALDAAQKLREKAGEEAKLRGEYFEKSQQEFKSGNKEDAKKLSEEGKACGNLVEKYNKEAADAFFAANNVGNDVYTIDLHGLYVEEALVRVKERFEKIGRKGTLIVIWGAGNHSEGGVRKIKPAVIDVLNAEKVAFDDDTPNHGCCTVYFSGKTTAETVPAIKPSEVVSTSVSKPITKTGKETLPITRAEERKSCCTCCCVI